MYRRWNPGIEAVEIAIDFFFPALWMMKKVSDFHNLFLKKSVLQNSYEINLKSVYAKQSDESDICKVKSEWRVEHEARKNAWLVRWTTLADSKVHLLHWWDHYKNPCRVSAADFLYEEKHKSCFWGKPKYLGSFNFNILRFPASVCSFCCCNLRPKSSRERSFSRGIICALYVNTSEGWKYVHLVTHHDHTFAHYKSEMRTSAHRTSDKPVPHFALALVTHHLLDTYISTRAWEPHLSPPDKCQTRASLCSWSFKETNVRVTLESKCFWHASGKKEKRGKKWSHGPGNKAAAV